MWPTCGLDTANVPHTFYEEQKFNIRFKVIFAKKNINLSKNVSVTVQAAVWSTCSLDETKGRRNKAYILWSDCLKAGEGGVGGIR